LETAEGRCLKESNQKGYGEQRKATWEAPIKTITSAEGQLVEKQGLARVVTKEAWKFWGNLRFSLEGQQRRLGRPERGESRKGDWRGKAPLRPRRFRMRYESEGNYPKKELRENPGR